MAQGAAGLVSPATLPSKPCLSSSPVIQSLSSSRSQNICLLPQQSTSLSLRHRVASSCVACTHREQQSGTLFYSRIEKRERGLQRRRVISEFSEARGHNEDASELVTADGGSGPRARFTATRVETYELEEVEKPLAEYMALPASQYSVLDAERIERVDDTTFKCYAHRLKFFAFEVGPVLLVKVEEQPDGCCIRLLSCTLEGSPIVVAQNKKFSASMVNRVSWRESDKSSTARQLVSDTVIEVAIEIPFAFRAIPVSAIERTGNTVMSQLLKVMLPRFLTQLGRDYYAWASGDASRKPVGNGEL